MLTSRALRLVTELGFDPRPWQGVTWLVLGGPPPQVPAWEGAPCWPALNCTSYQEVEAAIASLASYPLPSLILYDQEAWDLTPPQERRAPVPFIAGAAQLLRDSPICLGAAPSLTLAQELAPRAGSPQEAYLGCGIIEAAAEAVTLFHIQSQRFERRPDLFSSFVGEVAERARSSNPQVVVTAGVSTNPTGAEVSLDQLLECIELTTRHVDGYWINVPKPGRRCPHCRPENPALAAALLGAMQVGHGSAQSGAGPGEITVNRQG